MTSYMHLSQNESMGPDGGNGLNEKIDSDNQRYPYCIVWTPIPLLTWLVSTSRTSNVFSRFNVQPSCIIGNKFGFLFQFPFIGHMGIGTSEGVIRDFAGPYYVSEGNMAFGEPTRYLMLQPQNAENGVTGWDSGIKQQK